MRGPQQRVESIMTVLIFLGLHLVVAEQDASSIGGDDGLQQEPQVYYSKVSASVEIESNVLDLRSLQDVGTSTHVILLLRDALQLPSCSVAIDSVDSTFPQGDSDRSSRVSTKVRFAVHVPLTNGRPETYFSSNEVQKQAKAAFGSSSHPITLLNFDFLLFELIHTAMSAPSPPHRLVADYGLLPGTLTVTTTAVEGTQTPTAPSGATTTTTTTTPASNWQQQQVTEGAALTFEDQKSNDSGTALVLILCCCGGALLLSFIVGFAVMYQKRKPTAAVPTYPDHEDAKCTNSNRSAQYVENQSNAAPSSGGSLSAPMEAIVDLRFYGTDGAGTCSYSAEPKKRSEPSASSSFKFTDLVGGETGSASSFGATATIPSSVTAEIMEGSASCTCPTGQTLGEVEEGEFGELGQPRHVAAASYVRVSPHYSDEDRDDHI